MKVELRYLLLNNAEGVNDLEHSEIDQTSQSVIRILRRAMKAEASLVGATA